MSDNSTYDNPLVGTAYFTTLINKESEEKKTVRDPNRLDSFYSEVCRLHKKYMPDLRFGQLMSNFFGWLMAEKGRDLFFPEENEMLTCFKEYMKENCKNYDEE